MKTLIVKVLDDWKCRGRGNCNGCQFAAPGWTDVCPFPSAQVAVEVRRGGGVSMEYVKQPRDPKEPIFHWEGRPVRLYAAKVEP